MVEIAYPTAEKIIEYNVLALKLIKVKRADQPKILSHQKIVNIIDETKSAEGDIYDKAVVCLKDLFKSILLLVETEGRPL